MSFGLTVTLVCMSVTFSSLAIIALACVALRKAFPYKEEEEEGEKG